MVKKNHLSTGSLVVFLLIFLCFKANSQNRKNELFLRSAIPNYTKFKFPFEDISSRLIFYSFGMNYRYNINITDKVKIGPSISYNLTVLKVLFDLRDKTNRISDVDQISLGIGLNTKYCVDIKKKFKGEIGVEFSHQFVRPIYFMLYGTTIYSNSNTQSSIVKETINEKTWKDVLSLYFNFIKPSKRLNYYVGISSEYVFPNNYSVELKTVYTTQLGTEEGISKLENNNLRINLNLGIQF